MGHQSSQGTRLFVQIGFSGGVVTVTSATLAAPAILTCPALPAGVQPGVLAFVTGTGWQSLDGRVFQVAARAGDNITLFDSDTTRESVLLWSATGTVRGRSMVEFCAGSLDLDAPASERIDTTTTEHVVAQSIPGLLAAGSWTANTFWNIDDAAIARLRDLYRTAEHAAFAAQFLDLSGLCWMGEVATVQNRAGVDQAVMISVGGPVNGLPSLLNPALGGVPTLVAGLLEELAAARETAEPRLEEAA